MTDVLQRWHEFYTALGTASATLVGLLFVAASVGAGVFTSERRAPLRIFLSASVVNFGLILASCLVVLAPLRHALHFGLPILGCGMFGLMHSVLAWRDTLRDGLIANIDREDRTWYIALPIIGYLLLGSAGVVLALRPTVGAELLAVAMGTLLAVGIHNAWDITVWIITRPRQ